MLKKHLPFALVLSLILFSAMASTGSAASYWKQLTTTYPTANLYLNKVFFTSVTSGCTVGTDQTAYVTSNYGNTYTATNDAAGVELQQVQFINANVGYAAGTDALNTKASILKTTNGGRTWATLKTYNLPADPHVSRLYSVFFLDENTGWACGYPNIAWGSGGVVCRTIDGGASWTEDRWGSVTAGRAYDLYAFSASEIVAVCAQEGHGYYGIVKSTDGGVNWSDVAPDVAGEELYAVHFSGSTGWAVGGSGKILKSTDRGSSWSVQTDVGDNPLRDVYFINDSEGWVVGEDLIYHTTNGGITWDLTSTGWNSSHSAIGVHFVDQNNGWVCGQGAGKSPVVYKWLVDPTIGAVNQVALPAIATVPQGFSGDIQVTGTNFLAPPTVSCGSGITVNSVTLNSSTQLTANITVTASATPEARTVTVTNPDTGTGSFTGFAVTALPTITSLQYNSRYQGWSGSFTVTGTGFLTGVNANFGTGISVLSSALTGSTSVTFAIQIASDAPAGPRNIQVYNTDGGAASATFEVLATVNPPTLNNVRFNSVPYVAPTALYPTQEINANPTVAFDFTAPGGVSPESFRVFVINSLGYTEIAVPSTAYSAGVVTTTFGPLTAGDQTVMLTGTDLAGQGASALCYVWVRDRSAADRTTVREIIGYPNPWNPNAVPNIEFQMQSQADFPGSKFIILDSSGQVLYQQPTNITAGRNEIRWSGNGGFGRQVPTGILNTLVLDSTGARKFQGKAGVYHR